MWLDEYLEWNDTRLSKQKQADESRREKNEQTLDDLTSMIIEQQPK